ESSPNRRCPWWPASVISNERAPPSPVTWTNGWTLTNEWFPSVMPVNVLTPSSSLLPKSSTKNALLSMLMIRTLIPKLLWLVTFMVSSSKHGGS
ncbi:unnamed protein product, partial [Brassica napus]